MHKYTVWLVACGLVLVHLTSWAAITAGVNPFGNIIGTGTTTANGGGVAPWYDGDVKGSSYILKSSGVLYYEERWTTPQQIGTIMLDATDRQAGGTVFVTTSPGGPLTQQVATYSTPNNNSTVLVPVGQGGVYGVRVEVNQSTDASYYQIGEMEIWQKQPGANRATGGSLVRSGGSLYGSGNLTDQSFATEWRADENASVNWAGWEFSDNHYEWARGARISSTSYHGSTWCWRDFDVQVKQGGVWSSALVRAAVPAGDTLYWIDFGQELSIQGIRLYGSTADGNNPTANNGKIVDEIMIFIPEPGAALLLAAGLGFLGRRRRGA